MSQLKPSDLVIGNIFRSVKFGTPVICHITDLHELCERSEGAVVDGRLISEIFDPEPLDADWMRLFNFHPGAMLNHWIIQIGENYAAHYEIIDAGDRYYFRLPGKTLRSIKYVHELQDIYRSLREEELPIVMDGRKVSFASAFVSFVETFKID